MRYFPVIGFLAVCCLLGIVPRSAGQDRAAPKVLHLWPKEAPGAKGTEPKDIPNVTVYLTEPEKANGAALVICPGGGYGGLAMNHEGHQIAQWANSLGMAGIIVKYRVAPYRHPIPLTDAQRAV